MFTLLTARLFFWPPSDHPRRVDVVVVLGGGGDERMQTGLRLVHAGTAPILVVSAGGRQEATSFGTVCTDPAVVCVTPEPLTTAGEASTISALAREHEWDSAAVVTSTYHLTRARTLFTQCFDGQLHMVEAPVRRTSTRFVNEALAEWVGLVAAHTVTRAC